MRPETVLVCQEASMRDKDKKVPARHSLRLPLGVAARLAAWCELHPQRSKSEWVAEMLEAGLAAAERSLPQPVPAVDGPADARQPVYLPSGAFAEFHGLVQKHHLQLERERDHEAAAAPYPAVDYLLSEE
jgi:hypothetical protein